MPIQLSPQAHVSTIGVWSSEKYPFFQRLPQKFDTFLEKFRFLHPGLLMNSRTYLNFQVRSKKRL